MSEQATINDQISDSIKQIQQMIGETSDSQSAAVAQQLSVHAAALAMQNAVAQQQRQYLLHNAVVTAAAKAVIESNPKDALEMADKLLNQNELADTISGLNKLIADLVDSKPTKSRSTNKPGSKKSSRAKTK